MIPVIESEVSQHGWMTTQQFTDIIAISGMSPGPVTANSAILVGYSTAGFAGGHIICFRNLASCYYIRNRYSHLLQQIESLPSYSIHVLWIKTHCH